MSYVDSFSYEWNKFQTTQFYDDNWSQFHRISGLTKDDLKGKRVLDVGCGTGRFINDIAPFCKEIVGLDMSDSIEVAAELLKHHDNVALYKCDLHNFPLKRKFDIVYSIGVLHHTPNTLKAFKSIIKYVKSGGKVCIWVYTRGGVRRMLQNPMRVLIRSITTKLSLKTVYYLSYLAIPLYWIYRVFPPIMLIPFARHPDRMHRVLDTFDMYTPKYVNRHTVDEVFNWYAANGFREIKITMGDKGFIRVNNIGAIGTKK